MSITETTKLKRTSHLLETDVHGEVVALDVEKGQCYGLDSVGTEIWRLLEKETSVQEMVAELSSRYDVDEATCRSDVLRLVGELDDEGLLIVNGEQR